MTTKLILFFNDSCCLRFGGNYILFFFFKNEYYISSSDYDGSFSIIKKWISFRVIFIGDIIKIIISLSDHFNIKTKKISVFLLAPTCNRSISRNLKQDYNKKIVDIQYNALNLPDGLQFTNGNSTSYVCRRAEVKRNAPDGNSRRGNSHDQRNDAVNCCSNIFYV